MDNSREGLMHLNKKTSFLLAFDPITEQQEEMSGSSHGKNSQIKTKYSNKNLDDNITKNVLEEEGIDVIRHSKTHKNKATWMINTNNKDIFNKEDIKIDEGGAKNSIPKHKKKIIKRFSCQERRNILSSDTLNKSNNSEAKHKKGNLDKQAHCFLGTINSNLFHSRSNYNNTQDNSLNINRHYSNSKSIANFVIDYNRINKKHTVLHKGRLNFNEKAATTSIYEQIKKSESYEKSESLLFKLKICFGVLALFSFISIILSLSDSILYNNKSLEYIRIVNNNTHFDKKNIENYYCIKKRKISYRENSIRITNAIFCFLCFLVIIIIYKLKIGDFERTNKNTKKEKFKRMLDEYYNKQRKKDNKNMKQKEEKVNEKIKIVNFNEEDKKKNSNDKMKKIERELAIKLCIMNIIFYPPYINIAFIGKYDNIIYIYSLNTLFLIITLLKINNIYRAIFYLSPLNNSFNEAICKSNFLNLNTRFMFRYNFNKTPLTFLLINFIIIFITICLVLSCLEYFSIDINNNFWDDINENRTENFFHILSVFLYFSLKNIHEDHCIKSILGKIILLFGGMVGMAISSYFIFYMNNSIEFTREEQTAFSKLTKLLQPINKEHKASNLIKSILLIRKTYIDNKNTVKDYKLKKQESPKPKHFQRRPIFQKDSALALLFNYSNRTSQNRLNINEINGNQEKKKLIKYLISVFLFKIKVKVELKYYIDNLKVARNSFLSLTDILKTIGNKLDTNITQLNNKLEVLIRNDQRFLNMIKFTSNSLKKIIKITEYQNYITQYLTDIHNDHIKQLIEIRKEAEMNSPLLFKNSIIPKRVKSDAFSFYAFKSRKQKKFGSHYHSKKKRKKKGLYDLIHTKISVKKQKSSQMSSFFPNNYFDERLRLTRIKQNTNKSIQNRNRKSISGKRTKSLEEWDFIVNELKDKAKGRYSFIDKVERTPSFMGRNSSKK